jgi:hypothetical protein
MNVNVSALVPAVSSKGCQVRSQEKKDNDNEVIVLSSSDAEKDKDANVKDHPPAYHVVRTATSTSSDYYSDSDDICFFSLKTKHTFVHQQEWMIDCLIDLVQYLPTTYSTYIHDGFFVCLFNFPRSWISQLTSLTTNQTMDDPLEAANNTIQYNTMDQEINRRGGSNPTPQARKKTGEASGPQL